MCSLGIGNRAVFRPYVFECVLSGVLGGGRLCRKEDIYRVVASLVSHRRPTGCRRRVAAALPLLQPYFLLDGTLRDYLALVVGKVETVDSADWKNPLLMMRVACDSRAQRIVIGRTFGEVSVEVAARLESARRSWLERSIKFWEDGGGKFGVGEGAEVRCLLSHK